MGGVIRFLSERGNAKEADDTGFSLHSLGLISLRCRRHRADVQERMGLDRVWGVIKKVEVEAMEFNKRMGQRSEPHLSAFKMGEGSEPKKKKIPLSSKSQKKIIMQIYVTFVPNLTSSKVCLLPFLPYHPSLPRQVFPQYSKKMQIYIISKNVKPLPLAAGMVYFFLHSLKCAV